MSRNRHRRNAHQEREPFVILAARVVVMAAVILAPLVWSASGRDMFRLPKELVARAAFILLASLWLYDLASGGRKLIARVRGHRRMLLMAAAAVVWTSVCTLFSTNPTISVGSLLWFVGSVVFLISAVAVSQGARLLLLATVLLPAVLNAPFLILQEANLWNPYRFEEHVQGHARTTGTLGNPNDSGVFLVAPLIVAAAITFTLPRLRQLAAVVALLLGAGLFASQTLTALLAAAAGLLTLALLLSWRKALALAGVGLVVATVAVATIPALQDRAGRMAFYASSGKLNELVSGRLTAFAAAGLMFRDHPVTGTGPGTFGWNYFDYRLKLESRGRGLLSMVPVNFGEVHNDYLETLAETGVPGVLLFIGGLVLVGSRSFASPGGSAKHDLLMRRVALPVVIGVAMVALGQFPFQIAGTLVPLLLLAGTLLGNSEEPT